VFKSDNSAPSQKLECWTVMSRQNLENCIEKGKVFVIRIRKSELITNNSKKVMWSSYKGLTVET
jgi:hypothetical protein